MNTKYVKYIIGFLSVITFFSVGVARGESVERYRLELALAQCENVIPELVYKQEVISTLLTWDECLRVFSQHYEDYPKYWTGSGMIVFNQVEETYHFCNYLLNEYQG